MARLYVRNGTYYIDYRWKKKRVRQSCGKNEEVAFNILKKLKKNIEIRNRYALEKRIGVNNMQCPVCGKLINQD